MPAPAGGMKLDRIEAMIEQFGVDTVLLIGGALMQHPAGLTHKSVDEQTRQSCGITEGLMRLSVGLEELDDLWEDLQAALPA